MSNSLAIKINQKPRKLSQNNTQSFSSQIISNLYLTYNQKHTSEIKRFPNMKSTKIK